MNFSAVSAVCRILLLSTLAAAQIAAADLAERSQVWSVGGGSMELEIRGDYLPDFGIEILHEGRLIDQRKRFHFEVDAIEPIGVQAPWGIFGSLESGSGRLVAEPGLVIRRGEHVVRIDKLHLVPGERAGHPLFIALDEQGNRLLTLSHIHMILQAETGLLSAANAEVEASAYLADRLDFGQLSGMPIGTAWLELDLIAGERGALSGAPPGCAERPIWPQDGQFEADVTLIRMDNVVYQGTHADGRIKIAPSATLKNESLADVPWIGQFDSLASYPYSPADQHPYLVWNLYRIADGRIEMLAASGAKHAFFTINVNCDSCGSNNVLWPQCEDVYSAGSNDMANHQGPRNEIAASVGDWVNCPSFFDPGCSGGQTQDAGNWEYRLLIEPDELQQPGAEYFFDAWYVVQYDADIWNSMGHRPIDPAPSGGGWVMNPAEFSQGPVISRWIPEEDADPTTDHDVIVIPSETPDAPYPDNMPQGHLRLLVKVTEVEPGRYRYNYALQNYDFDRGLEGFRINVPMGSAVYETGFRDIDDNVDNDWDIDTDAEDHILFTAPAGNELEWFELFNFEIETDALPVSSEVTLDLGDDASQTEVGVMTLGPASGTGLLFEDRFSGFPQ